MELRVSAGKNGDFDNTQVLGGKVEGGLSDEE